MRTILEDTLDESENGAAFQDRALRKRLRPHDPHSLIPVLLSKQ